MASDIDELKQLAHKLETEDRGQKARLLSGKMLGAIPRFEATEEVCLIPFDYMIQANVTFRNGNVASIDKPASSSSSAPNLISHCMKGEHGASG